MTFRRCLVAALPVLIFIASPAASMAQMPLSEANDGSLYHNLSVKAMKGEIPYQQNFANPNAIGWSSYLGPAAARLFGRPYASGEFNGCHPSPFWGHTGPLEAALAGMQG